MSDSLVAFVFVLLTVFGYVVFARTDRASKEHGVDDSTGIVGATVIGAIYAALATILEAPVGETGLILGTFVVLGVLLGWVAQRGFRRFHTVVPLLLIGSLAATIISASRMALSS